MKYALLFSIALHMAMLGVLLWLLGRHDPLYKPDQMKITARLVRKGIERDKKLLPRKEEPLLTPTPDKLKAPPAVEKQASQTKKETTAIVSSKKSSVQKPLTKAKPSTAPNAMEALKRRTKAWKDEGNPEGFVGATAVTGSLEESYEAHIQELIQDAFLLPTTLSQKDRQTLKVVLKLRINGAGQLVQVDVLSPSYSGVFDQAALTATKRVESFGPPPLQLRQHFSQKGVAIEFCPIACE